LYKRSFHPALFALVVLAAAASLPDCGKGLSATIPRPAGGYVRVNEPVVVKFNQKLDARSIKVSLSPPAEYTLAVQSQELLVTPTGGWTPSQQYRLTVNGAQSSDHSVKLNSWTGLFQTQPKVGIAGFLIDGKQVTAAGGNPAMGPLSQVTITFDAAMNAASATPTVDGTPLPAVKFSWARDGMSVTLTPGFVPYQDHKIGVSSAAVTAKGDVATDLEPISVSVLGLEPSNPSSQIPAGWQTITPMMVVVEDSQPARPQYGMQAADMVFEYISEYIIPRFTLLFFNNPAQGMIGPVRSCRMINTYLVEAFQGIQMCSGASDGTLHYLLGDGSPTAPHLRININDYDHGDHFFRVNFKAAPHNLFTDSARVERLRTEWTTPGGPYQVDPSHPDNGLGNPAGPPSVPLDQVTYAYDGTNCACYLPFDQGTPRVDSANGGNQLWVKNVIEMHVPFHPTGFGSIWYDMNGSGPAEIWSDGKMIQATWHMGSSNTEPYYSNTTQPVYFTDQAGNLIRLNSGLTWIHTLGNGQNS
jgi:hypothetical protein